MWHTLSHLKGVFKLFTHFYTLHDVDFGDDSCGDKNPNPRSSLLSHKTVIAWCSTSSSSAGRPTGTRLSLSALSSSWSGGWRNGRSSMTEETGGLLYTACKFNTHTHTHMWMHILHNMWARSRKEDRNKGCSLGWWTQKCRKTNVPLVCEREREIEGDTEVKDAEINVLS